MCKFYGSSKSTHAVSVEEKQHDDNLYSLFTVQNEVDYVIKEDVLIHSYPLKMELDTGEALSLISSGTAKVKCEVAYSMSQDLYW